jgi:hypothetical protein
MMPIYIILVFLAFWVLMRQRTWRLFGTEISMSGIIRPHGAAIRAGALAAFIAAPLWAITGLWLSARKIISYDTEYISDFCGFWVVFFGGMLYAYLTPQPSSRLKNTIVVISWIIALLLMIVSCESAVVQTSVN